MKGDYSQKGDPYGIEAEYSVQSATPTATTTKKSSTEDIRGNTITAPRGLPTQAEVDAILKEK